MLSSSAQTLNTISVGETSAVLSPGLILVLTTVTNAFRRLPAALVQRGGVNPQQRLPAVAVRPLRLASCQRGLRVRLLQVSGERDEGERE